MVNYKTIGILGGMGPEATAELYLRIIRIFQTRYGARDDADFPRIFICSVPLPDVVGSVDTGDEVRDCLITAAMQLESVGCDFIAVPCNTVSYFLQDIRSSLSIPVLSVPEEVAKIVKRDNFEKVGLLATAMTIKKDLYGSVLKEVEIIVPTKEKTDILTKVILNLMSGNKLEEDRRVINGMIKNLQEKGAERIILGCTELPLLIRTNR